ncbi:MAG TPA: protein kinase, partial [Rhodanobacteraceae bacterium]
MKTLPELIAAFRRNELKLPALFDALSARGPVPEDTYQRERAVLERLLKDRDFNPQIAQALLAKLETLRTAVPAGIEPADEDVTAVQAITPRAPGEGVPRGSSAAAPEREDATQVLPSLHEPAADAGRGGAHDTGGSSTGGSGSSSWKRIADATQGEYATVGMLLKGRFLLEREIGRGGMGVVFVARDERKVEARDRDPYVAVKV